MRIISPSRQELDKLSSPLTPGERVVFEFLDRLLPPKWEIYIQPFLNGCRPDFVLLNPFIGIGVVEIKDWHLSSMRWSSAHGDRGYLAGTNADGSTFRERSPLFQIRQYKNEIANLYCPRMSEIARLDAIFAGVIFPFSSANDISRLFNSPDQLKSNEFIRSGDELAIGDVARLFPGSAIYSSSAMSNDMVDDFRSWLIEPDHAKEQRERLVLNSEQETIALSRTESGFRRIRGFAGTGKSTIIARKAAWLASLGKSVLVVTFNLTLIHYLRDLCMRVDGAHPNKVTWLNFHDFCKRKSRVPELEHKMSTLWRQHFDGKIDAFDRIPQMLLEHFQAEPPSQAEKYDAILVDEGQDFSPTWWQLLKCFRRDNGEMVLAADYTQDIYKKAETWTSSAMAHAGFSGPWKEFTVSYRMPTPVTKLVRRFLAQYLREGEDHLLPQISDQSEFELETCSLRWFQVDKATHVRTCVDELLNLIRTDEDHNRAMTDLTVITDSVRTGQQVAKELAQLNLATATTFEDLEQADPKGRIARSRKLAFWKGRPRIKIASIHSFKGWEARLIVLSITRANTETDLKTVYAGLTRVKRHGDGSHLTVVCSAERLGNFGRTWPAFERRAVASGN